MDELKRMMCSENPCFYRNRPNIIMYVQKTRTRVMFIDYEHVIKRCENACSFHSQMVSNLLQLIAMRSSQQANRIYVLSRNSIRKKIMAYLNEVGGEKKKQVFTLPVSYTTLAEYLCVDRSAMDAGI